MSNQSSLFSSKSEKDQTILKFESNEKLSKKDLLLNEFHSIGFYMSDHTQRTVLCAAMHRQICMTDHCMMGAILQRYAHPCTLPHCIYVKYYFYTHSLNDYVEAWQSLQRQGLMT